MTVLTLGTFDTPHVGHAVFLAKAASFGELTVGVNSDRFVQSYKGEKPLYTYTERANLLTLLGYRVVHNDGPGAATINRVLPKLLVVGSDWSDRDYHTQIGMTRQELDDLGVSLVFVPYTAGISTSDIRRRCG